MQAPKDLTPPEAHALLTDDPTAIYLDVRSSAEFAQGHPPRAVNVPLAEFDAMGRMAPNPDFVPVITRVFAKAQKLVVGCASGGRSRQACTILAAEGFTDLSNVAGGFNGMRGPFGVAKGWAQCDLPIARDGKSYDQVRAAL